MGANGDDMNSLMVRLRRGNAYLHIWPKERALAVIFPEYRIISATRLGLLSMPGLVTLSVLVQFQFGSPALWPSVVASVLFMASLPMQGLYWLGKRADTLLPPSLATWYRKLHEKMVMAGAPITEPVARPRYFELGEALNLAFKQLDKSFIQEL